MGDMTVIDWVGVVGSFMIAGAYLSATRQWMPAEGPAFNLLNLAGAGLILLSLYYRPNAGAIMIEVLWIGIAILALIRWYRNRA